LRTGGDELLVFNEESCRFRLFPFVVIVGEQGDTRFGTFVILIERIWLDAVELTDNIGKESDWKKVSKPSWSRSSKAARVRVVWAIIEAICLTLSGIIVRWWIIGDDKIFLLIVDNSLSSKHKCTAIRVHGVDGVSFKNIWFLWWNVSYERKNSSIRNASSLVEKYPNVSRISVSRHSSL